MTHIKFCDCLKRLLTDLGISSSRLAKAINVDSSLVNRWINGKRIPSYHADYIETIADYLCKNIHNTFQEQLINNLTIEVCGSIVATETVKDQIQYLLQEAQGYSMECAQKEKAQAKMHLPQKTSFTESMGLNDDIALSDNDRLLTNQFQIARSCIALIDSSLSMKKKGPRNIYIVYENHFFPDLWSPEDIVEFMNKLKTATRNGYQIVLLIRLNYDTAHTVTMMEFLQPFLLKGKLTIYYVPHASYTIPEKGLFLIPNVGLISGLSNEFISAFHYALFLTRPAAVELCQSHIEFYINKNTHLLSTRFHSPKYSFINIHQMEKSGGCRILLRYFFGMMTFPIELYRKLLRQLNFSDEDYNKSMQLYENRLNDFLENIPYYSYFDIYSASCLDELVKSHHTLLYSSKGVFSVTLTSNDILEHLQYIIHLLKAYDNYQIAFYQPTAKKNTSFKQVYCLLKDRNSVLFEVIQPTDAATNLRIYSDEPMLTSGFYTYLMNIWERIPPINKNKYDVIHWLSSVISVLQDEVDETIFLSKL